MEVSAYLVSFLAALYCAEYVYRSIVIPTRKYLYIGKALGRGLLAVVYFWIAFFEPSFYARVIWVRWSMVLFLAIDLFFVAQEHAMRKYIK